MLLRFLLSRWFAGYLVLFIVAGGGPAHAQILVAQDDSFVYRAVFGGVSDQATVTLTACSGGPQIFTCWKESAFLAKAVALGHPSLFSTTASRSNARPARAPSMVRADS
jgi:hypothetical protein